jgi:hypothetical protein
MGRWGLETHLFYPTACSLTNRCRKIRVHRKQIATTPWATTRAKWPKHGVFSESFSTLGISRFLAQGSGQHENA